MRRVGPGAWSLLAALGLLGLSRLEGAEALLPCLRVLNGGLGWALLGMGILVAFLPPLRPPVLSPGVLYALAFASFLALGLPYAARVQPSGDEPHYLIMAQSLWRDHDLDLRNNYAQGDYKEYLPGEKPLVPHYAAPRRDGRPFPGHSPGLPLLLAPIYALGGRLGCVAFMAALAGWLAVETWRLGAALGGDASVASFLVTLGPPLAFYSFHLYTEVPSALLVVLVLRLLLMEKPPVPRAALAATFASYLPWLHVKMIPCAAALGLLALVRLRGRARVAFLVVAGLGALLFLGYYQWVFGTPTPLAVYGGVPRDVDAAPLRSLAGLFFDGSFGLLPYAPGMVLALAGLPGALKGRKGAVGWLALVGASVVLPVLFWRMWWGGQCPPARFLVPILPVLGVFTASRMAGGPTGLHRWWWGLPLLSLALSVFVVVHADERLLLNHGDRPPRVWAALSSEAPRYLPSLVSSEPSEIRVAAVWAAALLLLLILDRVSHGSRGVDGLFRGLAPPLVLLLMVGEAVDAWARPPRVSSTASAASPLPAQARTPARR